jgi:hypothetical protein
MGNKYILNCINRIRFVEDDSGSECEEQFDDRNSRSTNLASFEDSAHSETEGKNLHMILSLYLRLVSVHPFN